MRKIVGIVFAVVLLLIAKPTFAQSPESPEDTWPMAAQNPQRTSHNNVEVPGGLNPLWFKPIEPHIPPKVQIIAANSMLYVSTARGLYAVDSEDGSTKWVYPTELPLGHSPAIDLTTNVLYVGGFDHKLHAIEGNPDINSLPIDTSTGQRINNRLLWTFEGEAGFDTNPLVVGNTVYSGNRDGYMYAVNKTNGNLVFKYKTDGPIHFSAAYSEGVVYFASNDSYAYALNATNGNLIWKSTKLPGAGFHSWWPVVYNAPTGEKVVVFGGYANYRNISDNNQDIQSRDLVDVYFDRGGIPQGTPIGPTGTEPWYWPNGQLTMDVSRFTEYFEEPTLSEQQIDPTGVNRRVHKPWRRTTFVLNQTTGQEYTFDSDGDGQREYAPFLWFGTHSGNRYPPIVGSDGVVYMSNNYLYNNWIVHGQIVGWKIGTKHISIPNSWVIATDEPAAYSGGGNLIYFTHCPDCSAGSFDISIANQNLAWTGGEDRAWVYWSYNLSSKVPGYNVMYGEIDGYETYGGRNGVYNGPGGDQNPPIPYKGKLYMIRGGSVLAFGNYTGTPQGLQLAQSINVSNANVTVDVTTLRQRLANEVQAILNSGHLRPGYIHHSLVETLGSLYEGQYQQEGDHLLDYFHNPADTIYALIRAFPYLPDESYPNDPSKTWKEKLLEYIQNEFTNYSPYLFNHIGWKDGSQRETFTLPPEVEADLINNPPYNTAYKDLSFWKWRPDLFYVLWKYAELMNLSQAEVQTLLNNSRSLLDPTPPDATLTEVPFVHNLFISGYLGYMNLEKLAGYIQSIDQSSKYGEYQRLLTLRSATFSKDTPYTGWNYLRTLSVSRNFMFMVPELADYLRQNALPKIQEAMGEYQRIAQYWFVSKFEATYGEGTINQLYDVNALFQAKALILKQPYEELVKYLDVPAFERGDLFYIQNLVSAIEAAETPLTCTLASQGDTNCDNTINISDLVALLTNFGAGASSSDLNGDSSVNTSDLVTLLTNFGRSGN